MADGSRPARLALAALASVALVALVTGAIFGLREVAPVLSLGVLYLFAVLPVAALWGLRFAFPVSVLSMLAFNFFFLPPRHTFQLENSENWVALAVYLATAVSVSGFATLRRREAGKTAILRSVSHDLRSPITAIMAAGEILHGNSISPAERDELLASIRTQVRRLDRSVSNLLDSSRLEAGAATPVPELWTVDGLIARALEALGPDHRRVDVELPDDSPPVLVDPTQLEHALVNLIENALKFSAPPARVAVSTEVSVSTIILRVADRGPGIAQTQRGRLFEPFEHGDGQDRGSGLGLSIARGFVEMNGGRIWVEPRPGAGSVFSIALPAAEAPEELPA